MKLNRHIRCGRYLLIILRILNRYQARYWNSSMRLASSNSMRNSKNDADLMMMILMDYYIIICFFCGVFFIFNKNIGNQIYTQSLEMNHINKREKNRKGSIRECGYKKRRPNSISCVITTTPWAFYSSLFLCVPWPPSRP